MSHGHPLDRYIGDAYPDLEDPRAVAAFERIPYDERIAVQSTYEALRVGASLAPDEPAIHFLLRGEPEEEPLTLTYRQYLGRVSQTPWANCCRSLAGATASINCSALRRRASSTLSTRCSRWGRSPRS